MRIIWSPRALQRVQEAADYIARDRVIYCRDPKRTILLTVRQGRRLFDAEEIEGE
ncbi:MAG: hypothetical protein HY706_12710 [Candidatus Hydrogenedentes bacterium]|nr:hypothetical protein [Candidatus Hydrogenedentota bacterium]